MGCRGGGRDDTDVVVYVGVREVGMLDMKFGGREVCVNKLGGRDGGDVGVKPVARFD